MKKIHEKISRLAELAAGWETHEATDPLERDLALELLRGIYADIKFAERASIIEPEPIVDAAPEPEPVMEPVACAIPEPAAEPEPVPEPVACAVPEPEPVMEQEPEPEPLPVPEPASEAGDLPSRHRRVNQDVIRSLYGDDSPAKRTAKEPEPKPEPAAAKIPEDVPEREVPQVVQASGEEHAPATIGDVMNSGRQTLGQTLQNGRKDMASKIAASERRDLRQSIGINDKFLMIRDMFDGNAAAFNDVIGYLDTFTDLDEAIIYIHETYDWSADSDGVKLLVELLERKLG